MARGYRTNAAARDMRASEPDALSPSKRTTKSMDAAFQAFMEALPDQCAVAVGLVFDEPQASGPQDEILIADPDLGLVAVHIESAPGLAFGIAEGSDGRPDWYLRIAGGLRLASPDGAKFDPVRAATNGAATALKSLLLHNRTMQNRFGTAFGIVALMGTKRQDASDMNLADAWKIPNFPEERLLFADDFADSGSLARAYEKIRDLVLQNKNFISPQYAAPVTALCEAAMRACLVEITDVETDGTEAAEEQAMDETPNFDDEFVDPAAAFREDGQGIDEANAKLRALTRSAPDDDAAPGAPAPPVERKNRFLERIERNNRKKIDARQEALRVEGERQQAIDAALSSYACCDADRPLWFPPLSLPGASDLRERHIETLRSLSSEDLKSIVKANLCNLRERGRHASDRASLLDGLHALGEEGKRRGVALGCPRGKSEDRILTARARVGGVLRNFYRDNTLACARMIEKIETEKDVDTQIQKMLSAPKHFGRPSQALAPLEREKKIAELHTSLLDWLTVSQNAEASDLRFSGEASSPSAKKKSGT